MKRIILIASLMLTTSLSAHNRAVLIGVSKYQDGSGWCQLSSHNDISLLKESLPKNWDVSIIEDEQATYEAIVRLLKATASDTMCGDTVFVHFSGHGQQMIPINNDYSESDYLDEAIIPYDACCSYSDSYHGEKHLRDNSFSELITNIRNKAGVTGFVIVSLDACHSDSMQKGDDDKQYKSSIIFRGTSDVFGANVSNEDLKKRYNRDTTRIEIANNAEVVYISACQSHSRNQEIIDDTGIGYGSLSFAVANSISEFGFQDIRKFLDHIQIIMDKVVPYQTPGIRASFQYSPTQYNSDDVEIEIEGIAPSKNTILPYVIGALLILSLIAGILWKKRNR